eukprot:TRINITY_DN33036_c0_g1_i1.p2 TRINITY_DN33036_c0_g1~~TRINITY_DN33036_c0_g1_i1.p2  ORF type:complete len:440 (+),score=226.77 TRINITY_DN33036_c0_g1_i1:22-1320(+)
MATLNVRQLARAANRSGKVCASLAHEMRNKALGAMADALEGSRQRIAAANEEDLDAARQAGLATAMINRLGFAGQKFDSAIAGMHDLQKLQDPINLMQVHRELADGLTLKRVTVPLGVLGIIFEARPDAAVQIAALSVKSGNGVLLKCGKEAVRTCSEIVGAMQEGLASTEVPRETIALLHNREQTNEMLQCHGDIDLIIPRGSNDFVQYVQKNTSIPVLGHADGICHVYVDSKADLAKALKITIDSKTQYPSACNSMETMLVHKDVAAEFIPMFFAAAAEKKVALNGCSATQAIGAKAGVQVNDVATYKHEYCDLECAVRVVDDLEQALEHIAENGSKHTDCIVTEDSTTAKRFTGHVASAGVFHNASTRFADGFRYGLGAEVGVSTSTMPPRGPVGLEGIVTYKYLIESNDSHTVTEFSTGERQFTHRDL